MSANTNSISELRALADAGTLTLVEREVLCDSDRMCGEDESAYASVCDVATIRSILSKLDRVPSVSRLTLTVETSPFCGKPFAVVRDGAGEDAETYACGNVDYVDGFMSAMRVAFTRISLAWYARGLM